MFPNILEYCVCIQNIVNNIPDFNMATRIASRWRLFWIHIFLHIIQLTSNHVIIMIIFIIYFYGEIYDLCQLRWKTMFHKWFIFVVVVVTTHISVVLFPIFLLLYITIDYPFWLFFFIIKNLSRFYAGVWWIFFSFKIKINAKSILVSKEFSRLFLDLENQNDE